MQRVLVMGSSGSGKSTFARRLSEITGIPFVSLDGLYWKPGWLAPDNAEFEQRLDLEFFRYVWTYRRQQRPKLLTYFQGLHADQSFIRFTDRTQANDYLTEIARKQSQASIH